MLPHHACTGTQSQNSLIVGNLLISQRSLLKEHYTTLCYTIYYFTCAVMVGSNSFFSAIARQVSFKPDLCLGNSPSSRCSLLRLLSYSTTGDRVRSILGCNRSAVPTCIYSSTCFLVISKQPCLKPGLHHGNSLALHCFLLCLSICSR